jgi:hypothetical protein
MRTGCALFTSISGELTARAPLTAATSQSRDQLWAGARCTSIGMVRPARVHRRTDRGYVLLRLPEHPLAHDGWVYEHRHVLYEGLGPGPQECWWCGIEVKWENGLQVDHLDHDRSNNDPANLVPSCQPCNQGRGVGTQPENWAISLATRRVLRRHANEFKAEMDPIRARLTAVPAELQGDGENKRAARMLYAAKAAYEKAVSGRARGRWPKSRIVPGD